MKKFLNKKILFIFALFLFFVFINCNPVSAEGVLITSETYNKSFIDSHTDIGQSPFDAVGKIVDYIAANNECYFDNEVSEAIMKSKKESSGGAGGNEDVDELFYEALKYVIEVGQASNSMIQRRFGVGYNRAGRLVQEMEDMGFVSKFEGAKPRQVLISMAEYELVHEIQNLCRNNQMRDIFFDEIETDDVQKHWGFTNYSISQLISFTPKELANIEQLQRRTTNTEMKDELGRTVEKIKSFNRKNINSIEKNIELIMQTEGYAVRQMPQYKISLEMLGIVREAVQFSKMVNGVYHEKERLLEPLGMIYGEKIYLVAREKAKGDGIYTYLLHKFDNLKLTEKVFDKGDFNLQEHTNKSFGVFQGAILDVKLSFSPELAQEASQYNFHPTQKGKWNEDGTYNVSFKASGSKEIIWHVFKWGAGCKILSPKSLQKDYKKYLQDCLNNI